MRLINLPTVNAGELLLVIALLLVVALSVPIWLNYSESVQAGHYSGNTDWQSGQIAPTPTPTPVISAGVKWHGAEAWQAAGYKGRVAGAGGRRIKVGIIDVGFKGFSDLQLKGELPSNSPTTTRVWTKCYPANTLANCEISGDKPDTAADESKHGAAVAEIVMDMAPEVDLYISNPPDERMLQETVVWMAQQGVDVINQSLRWGYSAPGDGTYVVGQAGVHSLKAINLAVNGGTVNGVTVPGGALWVNAGGNEALETWSGPFTDEYGRNNTHEFAEQDEKNTVHLVPGKKLEVELRWKDQWGYAGNTDRNSTGASCDLKLSLYRVVGNQVTQVPDSKIAVHEVSNATQSGGLADTPYEIISYTIPKPATAPAIPATPAPYRIYIGRKPTSPCTTAATPDKPQPAWLQVHSSVRLEHTSAGHHIAAPAESNNDGMLAVGAAVGGSLVVEDYSSRGPDLHNYPNGHTKPNLVGATCVKTVTHSRFCGTSAAAPHVAGLAALILGRELTTYENEPGALVLRLKGTDAVQRSAPNPNNDWGKGFVYLSHPTGTASFSVAHSVIPKGQSRRFTVSTNIAYPPGVQVKVSRGSLSLSKDCSSRTSTTRRSGVTVAVWGCAETSDGKVWIYDGNTLLQTHNVTVPPDAGLSGLTISSGTLAPTFAGGTTAYTAQVANNISSVTVTPRTTTPGATIRVGASTVSSGSGQSVNLSVGDNSISIEVSATGYTTRTYTVTVTRAAATPAASLSGLTISRVTLTPTFASGKTSYTAQVDNNISSVTVTPSTTTPGATIKIDDRAVGSGSGRSVNLIVGSTIIRIAVSAAGYTTRNYTVTVTRARATPAASLIGLTISSGTLAPTFAGGTTAYTAQVANNISSVTVTPSTTTPGATIVVGTSTVTSGSSSGSIALSVDSKTRITIAVAAAGYTSRTYTITVTRAAAALLPPTALSLSTVSGQTGWLRLTYTRSQAPHRYEFELHYLNKVTGKYVRYRAQSDSRSPETFKNVGRGYWYKARGRNCRNTAQSDTCGAWSDWSSEVEFSNPAIAISGLTGSYIAGDRDAYGVTLSDLTLDQPYTVTFLTSNSTIGYNYLCHPIPPRSFTALSQQKTLGLTLHTCQVSGETATAQSGTVTAQLRKGNARGAIVATATATVTVAKATGSLSSVPSTITVGHDRTLTLTTNVPNSTGVWVSATVSGDSGQLTLPPTRGCYYAISGLAAVNGNTLTLRGCKAGTARLTLYRSNSVIQLASYTVTVTASNTRLSPEPTTFTAGHDQTFTLTTDIADNPGVYITATVAGDPGRITLPPTRGCHQSSSGIRAVNGNTITIRGCQAGAATITIYRSNSGVLLKSYKVNVTASNTSLSPAPATFTIGTNQTFTLTTDIANTPGVWVGLNYNPANTGRLVMSNQNCTLDSAGTAAVNGSSITLKPCRAGTVIIMVNRSYSSVTLVSYTVTINSS